MSNACLIASAPIATFKTRADFLTRQLPVRIRGVMLLGFAAPGDAPPAFWVRMVSAPGSPHPGQKQTADGAWWQISPDTGNVIDVRWFGCKADAFTDDLAAFTEARDAAQALGYATILVPNPGMVLGTTGSPMSSFTLRGCRLRGQDANRTVIYLPGSAGISFLMDAAGGVTGGGLSDIVLWAPTGKTTGQALRLDGDGTYQPDETAMTNLKITGSGGWDIPLYLSGVDRATGSPPGLRKVSIVNCFIGRGTTLGVYADNVEELNTFGLGIYGGVVSAGNNITVTSTNVATRSSVVNLMATNCQGTLLLDRAQLCQANGNFNAINATANSLRSTGAGFCSTITNSGTGNSFAGFV